MDTSAQRSSFRFPPIRLPRRPHPLLLTQSPLDHFIAYALHRTWQHASVTFAALYLLQHLKPCFPSAKGSLASPIYFSFMLGSKIICDDTYTNKSCIASQAMLALRDQPDGVGNVPISRVAAQRRVSKGAPVIPNSPVRTYPSSTPHDTPEASATSAWHSTRTA
jgi:hypothetical protein